MLTDAGPLIALIHRKDPNHPRCAAKVKQLPWTPLLTTWPCFTEAMYLLFQKSGYPGQRALWRMVILGRLILQDLNPDEIRRSSELMDRYSDRPMDLADATLVALAETIGAREIFPLDSDFRIYRLANGQTLNVVP